MQWYDHGSLQPRAPWAQAIFSASVSQVAGTTDTYHHAWLIFVFVVDTGFCHVAQADLKFLGSNDLPASASQSAGITSVSHCAQPRNFHLIFSEKSFSESQKDIK